MLRKLVQSEFSPGMDVDARRLLLGSLTDDNVVNLRETPEYGVLASDEPVVANPDGAE